jgi:hypothetical protein
VDAFHLDDGADGARLFQCGGAYEAGELLLPEDVVGGEIGAVFAPGNEGGIPRDFAAVDREGIEQERAFLADSATKYAGIDFNLCGGLRGADGTAGSGRRAGRKAEGCGEA